jgi:hypothetical protein
MANRMIIIGAGLAGLLAGCEDPDQNPRYVFRESTTVRICADGTEVREATNGRLTFYKQGGAFFDAGASLGFVPKGITAKEFCA